MSLPLAAPTRESPSFEHHSLQRQADMKSNTDLCLTADKSTVVLDGMPEARYVLVGRGCEIPDGEAEKLGLLGGPYDAALYSEPPTEQPSSSEGEAPGPETPADGPQDPPLETETETETDDQEPITHQDNPDAQGVLEAILQLPRTEIDAQAQIKGVDTEGLSNREAAISLARACGYVIEDDTEPFYCGAEKADGQPCKSIVKEQGERCRFHKEDTETETQE